MPDLNPRQFDQPDLFPGSDFERGPDTVASFMRQATWHGTRRPDWASTVKGAGVPIHSGSPSAAAHRGASESSWRVGGLSEPEFHPVAAKKVSDEGPLYDMEANHTEGVFSEGRADRARGVDALRAGESVRYTNSIEDRGSTSMISPPGGFHTIDEMSDADQLPRTSASRRDFAQQGVETRDWKGVQDAERAQQKLVPEGTEQRDAYKFYPPVDYSKR